MDSPRGIAATAPARVQARPALPRLPPRAPGASASPPLPPTRAPAPVHRCVAAYQRAVAGRLAAEPLAVEAERAAGVRVTA